MSSTPDDYLVSAHACMIDGACEAHYRATSNRAYYSSFHAGKQILAAMPSIGSFGDATGEHEQTIRLLLDPKGNTRKVKAISLAVAGLLKAGCSIRVKADYYPNIDFAKAMALDSLDLAEQILAARQQMLEVIERQRDHRDEQGCAAK